LRGLKTNYNMKYAGKQLVVINEMGILKKGMRCCCLWETEEFVYLYFEHPVIGEINEIKILKNNLTNFKIVL
jgi:hypothetical protein